MKQKFLLAVFLTLLSGVYKPELIGFMAQKGYGFPFPYYVIVVGSDLIGEPFVPYINWPMSLAGFCIDVIVWFCIVFLIDKLIKIFHIKLSKPHKK